jgi:hypothetical protein
MKKHLKSITLLILFTTWYFINEIYLILTSFIQNSFYNYILLYSTIGVVIYLLSYFKTRQVQKSWVFAQVSLIFLLLYGFFKDKSAILLPILDRHLVAIPVWIGINAFLLYKIFRSKHDFAKLQRAATVCILLFLSYAGFSIFSAPKYQLRSENVYTQPPLAKELPNLYIFVFDEMARLDILEEFGYSSDYFRQQMEAKGVHYIPKSYSYSDLTPVCVSSVLNAYVTNTSDLQYPLTNFEKIFLWNDYKQNRLQPYLQQIGYDTKLFGIMPFKNQPGYTNYSILSKSVKTMLRQNTFMGRINEEISWNVVKYNVPILKKAFLDAENKYNYRLYQNDSINLEAIHKVLDQPAADKPQFILGHLLFPHYPFSRDTLGNFHYVNTLQKEVEERDNDYLMQAKYAERVMLELTDKIKKEGKPAVAIFMGDHGYRWTSDTAIANKSFLAYYTNLSPLPATESTSAVNLMRMILNEYYGFQLPMDTTEVKLLFY